MADSLPTTPRPNAPVVVFCYRRPTHLRRTLESLMRCDGFDASPIIVFGDGPQYPRQAEAVSQTRETARLLLGDRAEYHFRETNLGLARSVIEGVTAVLERYGRVIVVEDDLELAPGFLTYMNQSLERFENENRVWQISGYMFDVPEFKARSEALFLPVTVSWGWATWKRAWDRLDPFASGWETLLSDAELRHRFNLNGAYDYATMLERQMSGRLDSWAIRWYWTVFREGGLVLFPPRTLVRNHGFDGNGTHGRGLLSMFSGSAQSLSGRPPVLPAEIVFCERNYGCVVRALEIMNGGRLGKIRDILLNFFR